jgi:hypothetical protein
MRAGFSSRIITPPIGYEMPGSFQKRFARGVADEVRANACYIESAGEAVALISVDCVSFGPDLAAAARAMVEEHTDLPPSAVLIAATHTHSGGPTADVLMSEKDAGYCEWVAQQAATAVICARDYATDASLGTGSGTVPGIGHNRRWHLADGTVQTNPGNVPIDQLVHPAGPVDDGLAVIGVWDVDGRPLGAIINYTCHTTFMSGPCYSADYPGAIARHLGIPVVFVNGAMGDINQIDFTDQADRRKFTGPEYTDKTGRKLAAAAEQVLQTAWRSADVDAAVKARTDKTRLPLRGPDADAVAAAATEWETADQPPTLDQIYARELVLLERMIAETGTMASCELQSMQLGNMTISAAPLQPFCQLGLSIKAAVGGLTMVVSMANGCLGYIGPQLAYEEGGYELTLKRTSRLAPGSGERYVDAAIAALGNL